MTNPSLAPQIKSNLDTSTKTFAENKSEMLRKLEKIEELLDYVELGGGMHHHERLAARGKMAVRDRIANFIDPINNKIKLYLNRYITLPCFLY